MGNLMTTHAVTYINKLKDNVYKTISVDINENTIDQIVKEDLSFHLTDKKSVSFQDFYFQTLSNENLFFNTTDFFRQFKKQYSLQGIDNGFLDELESRKREIINIIRADKLTQLYFDTFKKAKVKYNGTTKEKELGSFFAKLVHTFRPEECCALDNPIKNYFGLGKESFFISFFIISVVYKNWATDNKKIIDRIRTDFQEIDKNNKIQHSNITDFKLLDLIFWTKADRLEKQKKKRQPITRHHKTLRRKW